MQVILIKKCKAGNVNDVIEVKDGYAKNFLIKNGFALAVNKSTMNALNDELQNLKLNEEAKRLEALETKTAIEKLTLNFKLKTAKSLVHGSVTKKQIINALQENEIKINARLLANVRINSLGFTNLKVKIYKDIIANLRLEIESE